MSGTVKYDRYSTERTGVHYDNPYNSTHFTNCCTVAVTDTKIRCPMCGKLVPESVRERDRIAQAAAWWRRV